jgi:two-component system, LytTR family, response regulator
MIKAVIIDDEQRATDALRLMIEKFVPEITTVHTCNDAPAAAELIHQLQPDLVFLDIRMPGMTGFDILKKIKHKNFKVIFTTAYNEYSIQAIRFSAFDYLLKPVDAQDLVNAVQRFIQLKDEQQYQPQQMNNMLENIQRSANEYRLALPGRDGIHFFLPKDIIRCEAMGNYTKFYTTAAKNLVVAKTLGEYDELLSPHGFIRTHKSHLVNNLFISFIDHDGFIILKDSSRVEISRRRKEEVMHLLKMG